MLISITSCLSILLWFFGLLLLYSFFIPSIATIHSNETDRLALLAVKSQLQDPLGATNSWNSSVPLCLWTGVSCSSRHQRVTKLDLRKQSIGGKLSPFIGNLSFLTSILLSDNNFYGGIPNEVGLLSRLQYLSLYNNSFSGIIPNNLSHCSNLILLYATGNKLHGEIPKEIDNLFKLETVSFRDNLLSGKLPPSIGNLSALQQFDVPLNRFDGGIPYTIGQVRSLKFLNVGLNNLSGMLPLSIFNLSSLEVLALLGNRFRGSLPHSIGYDFPKMTKLLISMNNFSGHIPESLSNNSNLEMIDLSLNYFSGKLSIDFSSLRNFSRLNVGQNFLGAGTSDDLDFLTTLSNCSKLEKILFYGNQFGGVVPKFIGNLSSTLTKLLFGRNHISGSIPLEIANLVNLQGIGMEENLLSGNIPHAIGQLKSLQLLHLDHNSLEGGIPDSLGNLSLLSDLALSSNNLKGSIPSSLGNCQNLRALDLSYNELSGILPQEILGITTLSLFLELSNNLLTGPFPSQLSNLKNLLVLNIFGNKFTGPIPSTLGSCTSLQILNMQENSFNGSIPPTLSSLKSIQEIDLSSNHLIGQIPKYLETFSFLVHLNLSYNQFEGEVPIKGVFRNRTGISLVGNMNLCGGSIELHFPSCPSKRSKKSKTHLVKVVTPVIVSCVILIVACFVLIFTRTRRSTRKSSGMLNLEEQFPMVSYVELSRVTDGFSPSNMIGQGSHGVVYKGMLGENRMPVAVKVINLQQKGGLKSFLSECEALRNIRHRNLIKIVTICSSIDPKGADFKALIYEYMENGNLKESLHNNIDQGAGQLSLNQRLNISIDVASAIEYLHHYCEPPIVHGDLKPCNVLLDHEMVAHVGDFGLSKFLSGKPLNASQIESSSVGIRGTIGYVAPEYGMGSEVSILGDVYSFGILLLEMFTTKKPTSSVFSDGLTLHEFVKNALPEGVMDVVDPLFLAEINNGVDDVENIERHTRGIRGRIKECLIDVLRIGVVCSMESPTERMEMIDAVSKLSTVREKFLTRRI